MISYHYYRDKTFHNTANICTFLNNVIAQENMVDTQLTKSEVGN